LAFQWVSPSDRWWLEAYGFSDPNILRKLADGGAETERGYRASRLPHPMIAGEPVDLTLKWERAVGLYDRAVGCLRTLARRGRVRREFAILRRLHSAGIACPRPLVCLERGLWPGEAFLLLEEIAGAMPLQAFLAQGHISEVSQERSRFFSKIGQSIAELHRLGVIHGALYAIHVVVCGGPGTSRFGFRNLSQSRPVHAATLRRRSGDLAALLATLPDRLAGEADRQCLVDAYIAESQLESQAADLLRALRRDTNRLLGRRYIWELRESDTPEHQCGRHASAAQQTRLWIDPDYRSQLERAGLATFDGMMNTESGTCLRVLKERENWRLDLGQGSARRGAYLKRHRLRTWSSRLRARLGAGPGVTAGRAEARSIAELNRAGIAAMRLIAFGERLSTDGREESFVVTEELAGYMQLDHFVKQRFEPKTIRSAGRMVRDLRALINEVADLAARFHRIGYNHRDFYCCHFFIKETASGCFKVNLIDLQRVEHRRWRRRRWIVKDLAQLAYSAPADYITCTQRLAFIKRYLGVERLRPRDKRLIRQVAAKQKLMEWQLGKHP
jgi:heptose I phosphotransferase